MSYKPERYSSGKWRRPHKPGRPSEEPRRSRSPRAGSRLLLFSNEDPERLDYLSVQNNRARLITQIVATQQDLPLREFTSYFRGAAKTEPPCLISSHSRSRRRSAVPLYPSLLQQTLKWNPFVATVSTSQEYVADAPHEHTYNCRCQDCTSERCPVRTTSANTLKRSLFKDNIISFCDQCTMTPKVNDVACGICLGVPPMTESKSVDVSATLPKTAMECESYTKCSRRNRSRTPPILKRGLLDGRPINCGIQNSADYPEKKKLEYQDTENCWRPTCCRKPYEVQHEAERDTDPSECYYDDNRTRPHKCSTLKSRISNIEECLDHEVCEEPQINETRRMLYNEGISDSTVATFPNYAAKRASPTAQRTHSKVSMGRCYQDTEAWIPYAHRGNSKYHEDCKKPPNRTYYAAGHDDVRHHAECPPHLQRPCKKTVTSSASRPVCISLPKKMLTSEKDIEAFIINGHKYYRVD